ncbi:hypothetical protein E2C01_020734 [Portunus trituberculatus]|uniref:Uncharacterized protein n=1 Tax=Portunus trituberculatus TaxID=210409 RepID=A0A5B7E0Q0_PORTR|nr:hypothetical protein [Portunus trituberculatus]
MGVLVVAGTGVPLIMVYFALHICQARDNEVTCKADSLQKLPIDLYLLDYVKEVLGGAFRVTRLPPL